jgi:Core-2/I-Branching enzyme
MRRRTVASSQDSQGQGPQRRSSFSNTASHSLRSSAWRWTQWLLLTSMIPCLFLTHVHLMRRNESLRKKHQQEGLVQDLMDVDLSLSNSSQSTDMLSSSEGDQKLALPRLGGSERAQLIYMATNAKVDAVLATESIIDDEASLFSLIITDYNEWFRQAISGVQQSYNSDSPIAIHSTWLELSHCRVDDMLQSKYMDMFIEWASPLLQSALQSLWREHAHDLIPPFDSADVTEAAGTDTNDTIVKAWQSIAQELTLELLEVYMTTLSIQNADVVDESDRINWCDWSLYRPTVPSTVYTDKVGQALFASMAKHQSQLKGADASALRLLIVIVAYKDVAHVTRLVQALSAPSHWIVIHVEEHAPAEFVQALQVMSQDMAQVVVLQFGTVIYKTDSVSMIHWRIMEWVHNHRHAEYDYYVALDGASFPLYTANDLNQHLRKTGQPVYLGDLLHKGQSATGSSQIAHWRHKRLVVSQPHPWETEAASLKWMYRLPRNAMDMLAAVLERETKSFAVIPPSLLPHIQYKSTSGNDGIYHSSVIEQILNEPAIRQLWALSKYGCCCCIEERSWIASLALLGYLDAAMAAPSMFQAWGGGAGSMADNRMTCTGGDMHNAVLSQIASQCFRIEQAGLVRYLDRLSSFADYDATVNNGNGLTPPYDMNGSDLTDLMRMAKVEGGYMFARKFDSARKDSMDLLDAIQEEIWPLRFQGDGGE